MRKPKLPKGTLLYVGLTEQKAKIAPLKGIEPPVILSDVYPGYFASSQGSIKWGIVQVDLKFLFPQYLGPFTKTEKEWRYSLKKCGVVLYHAEVSPAAITKISIYDPLGNSFITKQAQTSNNPALHRKTYGKNQALTRWLLGDAVDGTNFASEPRVATQINDILQNRLGLEVYYRRNEDSPLVSFWRT